VSTVKYVKKLFLFRVNKEKRKKENKYIEIKETLEIVSLSSLIGRAGNGRQ